MVLSKEEVISIKKYKSNTPYRTNITLTKTSPNGLASEIGIVDYNVNPEHIPKDILVEIEEKINKEIYKQYISK